METAAESSLPNRGFGSILKSLGNYSEKLPILIEFNPDNDLQYHVYNVSSQALYFEDQYLAHGASCIFSAFFSDHTELKIENYAKIPFRPRKFTEELALHCKSNPEDNRLVICDPKDMNAKEMSVIPEIKHDILVDPFTESIINGCGTTYLGGKFGQYYITHFEVTENPQDVEQKIYMDNRRDALNKVIAIFEKKKKARETLKKEEEEKEAQKTREKERQLEAISKRTKELKIQVAEKEREAKKLSNKND